MSRLQGEGTWLHVSSARQVYSHFLVDDDTVESDFKDGVKKSPSCEQLGASKMLSEPPAIIHGPFQNSVSLNTKKAKLFLK